MRKIPEKEVCRYFTKIKPGIDRLIKKREEPYDTATILESLLAGAMTLWIDPNGFVITEPRPPVYNIGLCVGGNIDEWLCGILKETELDAKRCGCQYVQVVGRKGWGKKMNTHGYKEVSTVLRKKI